MNEPTIPPDGDLSPPTLNQEIPDVMNDPAFNPSRRRDTTSSKSASDTGSDAVANCRICRGEGSDDEPLFHPCKCNGSIKFVHQECLMEWLSHSNKKHCELCKTPFRFTKLYDAHMPAQLPWEIFLKRAVVHVGQGIVSAGRGLLVGMVWMVILPWFVRWAWRWMFWLADAGWARESFLQQLKQSSLENIVQNANDTSQRGKEIAADLQRAMGSGDQTAVPMAYGMARDFVNSFGPNWINNYSATFNDTLNAPPWPQADKSVFSSWTYISEPTPNPGLNRMILDIFEGQLITCIVIIGFILVFLIREWVVQQQPLLNAEQMNEVQQRVRDATDRVNEDNERVRRQEQLLETARRRLLELERAAEEMQETEAELREIRDPKFEGWERLEETIDAATGMLASGDREGFGVGAAMVLKQIRVAGRAPDVDLDAFTNKIYAKLTSYTGPEKDVWEETLVSAMEKRKRRLEELEIEPPLPEVEETRPESTSAENAESSERPTMPDRGSSSMVTQLQRLREEADAAFKSREAHNGAAARPGSSQSSADAASASSSNGSEPVATPASGASIVSKIAELKERLEEPELDEVSLEIPVTNAGPDAKVNIKRSGEGRARAVPEPKEEESKNAKSKDDKDSAKSETQVEGSGESSAQANSTAQPDEEAPASEEQPSDNTNNNPFHPDGPPPADQANDESLTSRVASVFREEFGIDDAEHAEYLRRARHQPNPAQPNEASHPGSPTRQPEQQQPRTYAGRLAHWFWGDIQIPETADSAPTTREERVEDGGEQAAPFVPVQDGQPVPNAAHEPEPQQGEEQRDPEVVAAAAQAGVDAEAVEDAEDLEGIFELIGLQGPIAGLFQTSMFCLVLVIGTILGAVGLPYHWGKVVLLIIGRPFHCIFVLPLQLASFVADLVIDFSLFAAGGAVLLMGLTSDVFHTVLAATLPWWPSSDFMAKMTNAAFKTVHASGGRLLTIFDFDISSGLGAGGPFLRLNVNAHASLREIQNEVDAILNFTGRGLFAFADMVSTGSVASTLKQSGSLLARVPVIPTKIVALLSYIKAVAQPLLDVLSTLKTGALTIPVPSSSPAAIDPTLVFWPSTDRFLTVLTGYSALALLAAIYVIADTPLTRSPAGQKAEKQLRDTLRQAGGVLKVILIISIEMLAFPLYCGLLLDIAFLPLFEGASMSTRLAYGARKPYSFCFMHWFVGTCYMFHFALFVSMCRKILRKGVLWFIRDPDDPTFHPVRDVLERNVATQLRKIAFSALVYGALVILCLGGVIWTIGNVFQGIFPVQWMSTEPVFEFPADLLLYNFLTPVIVRLFKPSDAVHALYAWWLRKCARMLRLSHFLFNDRRKDEEGHYVHKTWASVFLPSTTASATDVSSPGAAGQADPAFRRSGKYVLTPCSDQYRPPKAGEAFLHTPPAPSDEVFIADAEGTRSDAFAAIYIPPRFRARLTAFMVCLWAFSAVAGLGATLVPLVFGRWVLAAVAPGMKVNDIYAYSVGAYTLGGALMVAFKGRAAARRAAASTREVEVRAAVVKVWDVASRSLKCVYVYGFLGIVLPTLFALALQSYLVVPLHTWSATQPASNPSAGFNATAPVSSTNDTFRSPTLEQAPAAVDPAAPPAAQGLAPHTIHLLQDYALGLLYTRLLTRSLTAPNPTSAPNLPTLAFSQITAKGYTNPYASLFTRAIVLPTLLLACVVFFAPPAGAWAVVTAIGGSGGVGGEVKGRVYRFAYPVAAGVAGVIWGVGKSREVVGGWRGRVRDEVYLVGERLHNFGDARGGGGGRRRWDT